MVAPLCRRLHRRLLLTVHLQCYTVKQVLPANCSGMVRSCIIIKNGGAQLNYVFGSWNVSVVLVRIM